MKALNLKKLLLLASLVALLPINAAMAKSTRVDICHVLGNGGSIGITVDDDAVPAHLAHGDFLATSGTKCPKAPPTSDVSETTNTAVVEEGYVGYIAPTGEVDTSANATICGKQGTKGYQVDVRSNGSVSSSSINNCKK